MKFKERFGFNSNSNFGMLTDSSCIIAANSDIMSLFRNLRFPMLHQGRTDSFYGHSDDENKGGLGSYHYHHGEEAHLHLHGVCPYDKGERESLIKVLRGYESARFITKEKVSGGKKALIFEANIAFSGGDKIFSLEIEGEKGEFCLYENKERKVKENFFGTPLDPVRVTDENSPWVDGGIGVDYIIRADYLHALIKGFIKVEPMEVFAVAGTTDGEDDHYAKLPISSIEANAKYIYNYLRLEGWSKEAICGLLGNLMQESKMNPGAWEEWNNPQKGYGIVQWTPNDDALEKFLQENKLSPEDVNELANKKDTPKILMDMQLEYLLYELANKGEWLPNSSYVHYQAVELENQDLKGMSLAEYKDSTAKAGDLALVFHASYERSGDSNSKYAPDYERLNYRKDQAEYWYTVL